MITKLFKTGLSLILSASLLLLPSASSPAFAAAEKTAPQDKGILAEADSVYGEAQKIAEEKMNILTSFYGVTSVQYALMDGGKIVLTGQKDGKSNSTASSLTADTMYGIGSVSKMFTATAVMQLAEQGKVNLDTPVVQYIPEFTMADPRYKDITVRMLLNHSSGLMGSSFSNAFLFDEYNPDIHKELLSELKTQRLKADPGAYSVYCNDGFTLAELLVERVTGLSFSEYIHNYITEPLALNNIKTPADNFSKDLLAKTYINGLKKALPVESLNVIGAGGIYSSASDLCRFAGIFMEESDSSVLSQLSAKQMAFPEYRTKLWPEAEESLFSYGLGWDNVDSSSFKEYGIQALSKGGDTLLYHSSLTVLPKENMAIAVNSSGGASPYNELMAKSILLAVLKEKGRISEIKADSTYTKPVKAAMPEDLLSYEGIYANYSGAFQVTISKDGVLTLTDATGSTSVSQKFLYTGDGLFYFTDGSFSLSFVKGSNGNTYLKYAGCSSYPSLGQLFTTEYLAQKLENNPVSESMGKIWKERSNKTYYLVNEKYNSQLYVLNSISMQLGLLKGIDGYFLYDAIKDDNQAEVSIQIPGLYGRDLFDASFTDTDNTEYLNLKGNIAISEDSIPELSSNSVLSCQIGSDGYAKWFKIGEKSANRTLSVTLPSNASFSVYDAAGKCINCSYISKQYTVTLPSKGHIVFVGDAGATFSAAYLAQKK